MRWILRHAVLALCFSVGSTAWYILARQEPTPAPPARTAPEPAANQEIAQDATPTASAEPKISTGQSIRFGPIEPILAYANTETVILRESAEANAPVVARLKAGDYKEIYILEAKRDFLHVQVVTENQEADELKERNPVYRGWTTWDSVVPDMIAIVMDAETGSVVSRVPLSEGLTSIIYSPDGAHAIFSAEGIGSNQRAYEVRTSDYTLTRSLAASEQEPFNAAFYAPASGDVYARVYGAEARLIRVGDGGAENTLTDIAPHLVVSRDGLTGLIARRVESDAPSELTIDMLELATLEVRNTFKLRSENLTVDGGGFVLNKDGSELYVRVLENTGAISVIDTRTGQFLRELKESATEGWSHFWQESIVRDSILLRVWDTDGEEMHHAPTSYWISSGSRMLAEKGVDFVADAGGKGYAVNDDGTLLFRLNDNNRIQKRFRISRPDRREGAEMGNSYSVLGFSASPDGKRLIMLVGSASGC